MHIDKYSMTQCGHLCAHFERSVRAGHYSNENIDSSRTHLNENLCKANRPNQIDYIRKMLDTVPHVNRKDLVVMGSIIVDAPKNLDEGLHDVFFALAYDFLVDRYGSISGFYNKEDIVISCYRHKDETTDHIHFAFLPIKADNEDPTKQRFVAKEVICRQDLRTLHQDFDNYLKQFGLKADVLNGRTQRNEYGRALTVKELKNKNRNINRDRYLERERF